MIGSRTPRPILASLPVLLALALAGCMTHVGRCPAASGAAQEVPVAVHAVGGDPALRDEIRGLLTVRMKCGAARYDPVTEQARWFYKLELSNVTPTSGSGRRYDIHLTTLERIIANGLEAMFDGKPTIFPGTHVKPRLTGGSSYVHGPPKI